MRPDSISLVVGAIGVACLLLAWLAPDACGRLREPGFVRDSDTWATDQPSWQDSEEDARQLRTAIVAIRASRTSTLPAPGSRPPAQRRARTSLTRAKSG